MLCPSTAKPAWCCGDETTTSERVNPVPSSCAGACAYLGGQELDPPQSARRTLPCPLLVSRSYPRITTVHGRFGSRCALLPLLPQLLRPDLHLQLDDHIQAPVRRRDLGEAAVVYGTNRQCIESKITIPHQWFLTYAPRSHGLLLEQPRVLPAQRAQGERVEDGRGEESAHQGQDGHRPGVQDTLHLEVPGVEQGLHAEEPPQRPSSRLYGRECVDLCWPNE